MSFSSEIKEQIMQESCKRPCCRRALLRGAVFARGELREDGICLRLGAKEIAAYLSGLTEEIYSRSGEFLPPERGGRGCLFRFSSPAAERTFAAFDEESLPYRRECLCCEEAFLRGMFLSCGRVSDPRKGYSVEFSLAGREALAEGYFAGLSLSPRLAQRGNERILYFHKESDVEDILARMGMQDHSLAIMGIRAERDLRSEINRTRNIETFNIQKAMDLSAAQVAKLRKLDSLGLLTNLPDELVRTARLRMEYDTLSLSQLAAMMTPKISRSGLARRMKLILKMADELLAKH